MALTKVSQLTKAILTGASFLARGGRVGTIRGRILMYHRVDEVHGDRLVVTPDHFRAQLEWLRRHQIRVVDLDTLVESLKHPDRANNQLAITFDDGYEDNARFAWPILRSYRYPATIFVSVGLIGTETPIPAERPGATRARLMTWAQVKAMADDGIAIGSHGMTHQRLTRLAPAAARAEITESKRVLEEQLGRPAEWFCYPSGSYSQDLVRTVQWAGYHGACSVRPGANTPRTHRFALRRTEISGDDTLAVFERKLAGAYDGWHTLVQAYQHWQKHRGLRRG